MKTKLLTGFAAAALSFSAGAQDFDLTFNGNGWREDTISSGLGQSYHDAIVQSGQKLVVSGLYEFNNFLQDISVVRYNVDGTLDNSFGTGGKVRLAISPTGMHHSQLAKNAAGEIFVAGSQANADGPLYVCKLTQNGSIDNSFGTNGVVADSFITGAELGFEHSNAIAVQADGKVLVGGYYHRSSPTTEYAAWVIRYNTDGSRDNGFGTNGVVRLIGGGNGINKLVIQPDGKILAGGYGGLVQQQQQDWLIARLNTDGTLDNSFGGQQNGIVTIGMQYTEAVEGMALQSDGSIIIGGGCGNGNPTFRIVKLTSSGLPDPNFGTSVMGTTNWGYTKVELQTFTNHYVAGLAVLPGDKIAIVGTVGGFKFAAIRFSANGDPDSTFGTNAVVDSQVLNPLSMGMQGMAFDKASGRLYAVGSTYNSDDAVAKSAVAVVKVAGPTSVNEHVQDDQLSIYPNPVGSRLHLGGAAGAITVYDISGRSVLTTTGNSIDVSQLTTGMYILKCTSEEGSVHTAQFVKD